MIVASVRRFMTTFISLDVIYIPRNVSESLSASADEVAH
jgi:hypothetical protein